MPIQIRCTNCSRSLALSDQHAGKKTRCPACFAILYIPAAHASPPAPRAPATSPRKPSPPPAPPLDVYIPAPSPQPASPSTITPPAATDLPPSRARRSYLPAIAALFLLVLLGGLAWYFTRPTPATPAPVAQNNPTAAPAATASRPNATIASTRPTAPLFRFPTNPVWSATPDPCTLPPFSNYHGALLSPADDPRPQYIARLADQYGPFVLLSDVLYGLETPGVHAHEVFDLKTAQSRGAVRSSLVLSEPRLSPDGRYLSARTIDPRKSNDGSCVDTFSVETGKPLVRYFGPLRNPRIGVAGYAGDTAIVCDASAFTVWDIPAAKRLRTIDTGTGDLSSHAVSPNGKLLAVGRGNDIYLSDVQTGGLLGRLDLRPFIASTRFAEVRANTLAFSRDGTHVVSYCGSSARENLILSISVAQGVVDTRIQTPRSLPRSFHDRTLLTAGAEALLGADGRTIILNTAMVYDVQSGQLLGMPLADTEYRYARILTLIDADHVLLQHEVPGFDNTDASRRRRRNIFITSIAVSHHLGDFAPDFTLIQPDGVVNLRNLHAANSMTFSPDGHTLALCFWTGACASLWDTVENLPLPEVYWPYNADRSPVAFTPAGQSVIAPADKHVAFCDLATRRRIARLPGTLKGASRNGKFVLIKADNLDLYDEAQQKISTLDGTFQPQTLCTISDDGAYVLDPIDLQLWDGATGKRLDPPTLPANYPAGRAAFLTSSSLFIYGHPSFGLYDLRARTVTLAKPTPPTAIEVQALASPDASVLALLTRDALLLFRPKTLEEIGRLKLESTGMSIAFSPDSQRIAVSEANRTRLIPLSLLLGPTAP